MNEYVEIINPVKVQYYENNFTKKSDVNCLANNGDKCSPSY